MTSGDRSRHVGRLFLGMIALCTALFFSSLGAIGAEDAGYHWAVGAFGIYLLLPSGYLVGTVLDKSGVFGQ